MQANTDTDTLIHKMEIVFLTTLLMTMCLIDQNNTTYITTTTTIQKSVSPSDSVSHVISLPPDPRDQLGLRCWQCERPDTTVLFVLCLHRHCHHPRPGSGHHILSVTRLDELLIPAISFNKSMSTHTITISFSGLNKTFFRRSEMSKLTKNSNYFIEKTFRAEIY